MGLGLPGGDTFTKPPPILLPGDVFGPGKRVTSIICGLGVGNKSFFSGSDVGPGTVCGLIPGADVGPGAVNLCDLSP